MPQSYFDPQLMESVASLGKIPMQMQQMKEQMDMNKLKMREGEANIEMHKQNMASATQTMLDNEINMLDKYIDKARIQYGNNYVKTSDFQKQINKIFPHTAPNINVEKFQFDDDGGVKFFTHPGPDGKEHSFYKTRDDNGKIIVKEFHPDKEETKTESQKNASAMGMTLRQYDEYKSKQKVSEKTAEEGIRVKGQIKVESFKAGLKPSKDKTELSADAKMKAIEKWDKSIANPNIKSETKKGMIKQRDALAEDIGLPPYEETEELSGSKKAVNWATEGLGLGTAFKPTTTGTSSSKIDKSKLRFME